MNAQRRAITLVYVAEMIGVVDLSLENGVGLETSTFTSQSKLRLRLASLLNDESILCKDKMSNSYLVYSANILIVWRF